MDGTAKHCCEAWHGWICHAPNAHAAFAPPTQAIIPAKGVSVACIGCIQTLKFGIESLSIKSVLEKDGKIWRGGRCAPDIRRRRCKKEQDKKGVHGCASGLNSANERVTTVEIDPRAPGSGREEKYEESVASVDISP
ncbi:hypothetical protein PHLCEN_2v2682 [Hermanssonia centrifuga]|uniref:Uncharacterized protein n=1 Tax=Hermanssonia centrifuga TaxID=98765 RepID=A0A2R6RIJ5_9APHY|nr:hypothetical protein PHLCEN_2v2682 [Hermanssonia centrifuga]